jgi:ABC-type amino acid transport substrate-binding protein
MRTAALLAALLLASCAQPVPLKQQIAQCEVAAAKARNAPSEVDSQDNDTYIVKCMEARGFELDWSNEVCARIARNADEARCYKRITANSN